MRQAISPRLAIRILRNIPRSFPSLPIRLALLEEGRDAFLAFCRRARVCDPCGGVAPQRLVDWRARYAPDQVLRRHLRRRPAVPQVLDGLVPRGFEHLRLHHTMDEAELCRRRGIELLRGQEIAPAGARPDRRGDIRRDDCWYQS